MAETTVKKKQEAKVETRNGRGYSYKYADLAAVHAYLEEKGETYYQDVEVIDGVDYIVTHRMIGDRWVALRGVRIMTSEPKGNPAQEQGAAVTYARRYSLLMAYGLATEDDDAQSLTRSTKREPEKMITPEQASVIARNYDDRYLPKLLDAYQIDALEKMTEKQAADLIKRYKLS